MLCHACHVHLRRDYPYCLHCGTLRRGAKVESFDAPELRWAGQVHPLVKPVTTIGRSTENDIVLDDASVSRRHARVLRTEQGFHIEDLNSFNGTTVAGRVLHGNWTPLADEAELSIGDVPVRFAQPRGADIGSKTMLSGEEPTVVGSADPGTGTGGIAPPGEAPTATGPLQAKPRRRSSWALKQVPDSRGDQHWVLRNTRTGQYLQLDDRDVFIWHQLDGENTIRDVLFAYAQRYGELALPRIERTVATFAALELVRGMHGQREATPPTGLRRVGRAVLHVLLRAEISVRGLDGFFHRVYRGFGWRFFTRTGVALLWLLIVAGFVGMVVAGGHQRLFDVAGAGLVGALVIGLGYLVALVIHESAHALAVKSYGRTVTRGGFMLMMGMPFAFVDTSDMWFGGRWSRIVVTMSGPLSTAGVAGVCALTAAYAPDPRIAAVAYQLAFGLYLNTLYNLNPLMPLDGYQALADVLRLPRLREEATAYFTRGIWSDLRGGRRPGLRQFGLAAYGLSAVAGTGLFVVMGFLAWRDRLGGLVERYLPPGIDVLVITLGIGLIMFPIWYRLARKLAGLIKSRRTADRVEATS